MVTPLKVVGAGLPRTGTTSLKGGLETLLGGDCYHMFELFPRIETDGPLWFKALHDDQDALAQVLADWTAAVDWPASIFWRELAEMYPDAVVVLSHRDSAEQWWSSANATVWQQMRVSDSDITQMFNKLMRERAGLGDDWDDPAVAMAWYEQHLIDVQAAIPAERLVMWKPSDGWQPLCDALDLPVPDEDFYHRNDRSTFIERADASDTQQI